MEGVGKGKQLGVVGVGEVTGGSARKKGGVGGERKKAGSVEGVGKVKVGGVGGIGKEKEDVVGGGVGEE